MPNYNSWSAVSPIPASGDANFAPLLGEYRWSGATVSYSFPNWDPRWSTALATGYGPSSGNGEPWSWDYMPLTREDQGWFRKAAAAWQAVANLRLVETSETGGGEVGDIRVAYSSVDGEAWAYPPGNGAWAGDIWIAADSTSARFEWERGSYSYLTVLHELGHALGLDHPFAGPARLPSGLDSMSYTVMSYSARAGGPLDLYFSFYPTTPMVGDIAAMQHAYGPNDSTAAGDDRYAFDDSQVYHETIWDGSGHDTLSYSGACPATIDLRQGQGSTMGQPVHVVDLQERPLEQVSNVWIARGARLEDAVGGSNADSITGNELDNRLSGGAGADSLQGMGGDDVLDGGPGNDWLDGGAGIDVAVLPGTAGGFDIQREGIALRVSLVQDGTLEHLSGVERLRFDGGSLAFDLDGHAGVVARLLGAVFGHAAVGNPGYAGIGLALLDGGTSEAALAQMAIDFRMGTAATNREVVDLLYTNLVGTHADEATLAQYASMLDQGSYTRGGLALFAVATPFNEANINLVGLAATGLAYA